jgi:ATP-dependent Lhr-like helicase
VLAEEEVSARPKWQEFLDELVEQRRVTRLASRNCGSPSSGLPEWRAAHPKRAPGAGARAARRASKEWERGARSPRSFAAAWKDLGPVAASALAASLSLVLVRYCESRSRSSKAKASRCAAASRSTLARKNGASDGCLRGINRYTLKRLRAEIEPVSSADYMRFLARWQRLAPGEQMEGPDAVAAVIAQLEGFQAPAIAWETEILPARVAGYDPQWLDDLCRAGRVVWTRLDAPRADRERVAGRCERRR